MNRNESTHTSHITLARTSSVQTESEAGKGAPASEKEAMAVDRMHQDAVTRLAMDPRNKGAHLKREEAALTNKGGSSSSSSKEKKGEKNHKHGIR